MRYRLNQFEKNLIKGYAQSIIGYRNVRLEAGVRFGPKTDAWCMNIAMVTDHPTWDDTDLADFVTWRNFLKGVELTEDGRGIVDLYVSKGYGIDSELMTNIVAEFDRDGMTKLTETAQGVIWDRSTCHITAMGDNK